MTAATLKLPTPIWAESTTRPPLLSRGVGITSSIRRAGAILTVAVWKPPWRPTLLCAARGSQLTGEDPTCGGDTLAPLMRSQKMIGNSPKRNGIAARETTSLYAGKAMATTLLVT